MIRSAVHSAYPRIGDFAWDQQLRSIAEERDAGRATEEDVRRIEDEVATLVVAEQSRAFLDVVTDGLVRWSGPNSHFAARLEGVALGGLARWFETGLFDRTPIVVGAVSRREPIAVRDAHKAFEVRPKALKAVLPGAVTFARAAKDRHYGKLETLAAALAGALADEARDLANVGVRILQLDEPVLCRHPEDVDLVAESARTIFAAAGDGATTILSTYFGDLSALGVGGTSQLPGTHLGLDMVHGPGNWPLLAELPSGRGVHLGLFDARTTRIETAQEVAERLVPYCASLMARDVMVGPQCSLELIPRDEAFDKLLQARYLKEKLEREWSWRS